MPPKDYSFTQTMFTQTMLQDWIKAETDKKHSMAVKYIEENVDLIDTDLQKFMDNCPSSCQLEVYEMLLKAGIDMKGYVRNDTLKNWEIYFHDTNPQFSEYYNNIEQKLYEYIDTSLKHDWELSLIRWEEE